MRIIVDRETCFGAGLCVLTEPAVFEQDQDDGRVLLVTEQPDESARATVEEAVRTCPSRSLSLDGEG